MEWCEIKRKFFSIFDKTKKHRYLEEAGIVSYPENNWGGSYDFRSALASRHHAKRAKKTGVDPRGCWEMDIAFYCWLYEHLRVYLEDSNLDLEHLKFYHMGQIYTEREYVEYLGELCLKMLKENLPDAKIYETRKELHDVFFELSPNLWW